MTSSPLPPPRASVRSQARYTIADKRAALADLPLTDPPYRTVVEVAKKHNVKVRTLRDWMKNRDKIEGFSGGDARTTLGGQGRRETMPFARELVAYARAEQRENETVMTGPAMVAWIQHYQPAWMQLYMEKSPDEDHALASLLRMCERLAVRHGISQRQVRSRANED